jgi:hypothetical protein
VSADVCPGSVEHADMTGREGPSKDFLSLLDAALKETDAQAFVTQSRCVDHLLDLMNATESAVLRRLVVGALDSVRQLGVVRGDELHFALSVLAAAANVELAATDAPATGYECC